MITQEQAAEALEVSRQTISNWENSKSYPDIISVIKLSDIYSIKDIFYIIDIINGLVDKIKFVSRQSIVVITNFLLMANKFTSSDEEEILKDKKDLEWYIEEYSYLLDNIKTNLINLFFNIIHLTNIYRLNIFMDIY